MSDATKRKTPIGAHLIRKLSVEGPADPRTIRKVLLGLPVSPMARERVIRALRARGLEHLVPDGHLLAEGGGRCSEPFA